jgi:hypothetical protein
MATVPPTARPTPQDGPVPAAAETPHAAAGATLTYQPYVPDCPWCADVGLVLAATVATGRADWTPALTVVCICRATWSAA